MKKKKAPRGRPPMRYGKKDDRLVVKMPQTTKEMFRRAANAAELELSDWVRTVLEDAARRQLGES